MPMLTTPAYYTFKYGVQVDLVYGTNCGLLCHIRALAFHVQVVALTPLSMTRSKWCYTCE